MGEIKYFNEVPKSELNATGDAIRRANGKVMLVVHPFDPQKETSEKEKQKFAKYEKVLFDTMAGSKRPIIVFEEVGGIERTRNELLKRGINALILPTVNGMSILNTRAAHSPPSRGPIISLLKLMGAKKIIIGGAYTNQAFSHEVWEHEAKSLQGNAAPSIKTISTGCVGGLYRDLIKSGNFEAIHLMPAAIFGNKPKLIRTKRNIDLQKKRRASILKKAKYKFRRL